MSGAAAAVDVDSAAGADWAYNCCSEKEKLHTWRKAST